METNPSNTLSPEAPASPSPAPRKMNWLVFFGALFGPTLLTIATIRLGASDGDPAPAVAALGGIASGLIGGTMLGRRIGNTLAMKIVLGAAFGFLLAAACVGMNCFGCLAGGYDLNLH